MDKINDEINSSRDWSIRKAETLQSSFLNLTVNDGLRSLQNVAVLTGSFYFSMNAFQRIAGRLAIHSGRPFLLASSFGILSVATSSAISIQINESLPYVIPESEKENFATFLLPPTLKADRNILSDKRIPISIFAYYVLEARYFLTGLPSSVISIGVHANHGTFYLFRRMFQGSVISTDATATEKQRKQIQQLGKR